MIKVLVTGGSGFIATHILKVLLQNGYNVITTVRCKNKADMIKDALASVSSRLDFRIVEDIAQPGAFDEALRIEGLEVVIHTASPFQLNVEDIKGDLLDPAVEGTKGILAAIKKNAPSVKKVIITSSIAAIRDFDMANAAASPSVYSEKNWNPITEAHALQNPLFGYMASKTFAERAAWDFAEKEKPNFKISTINPPLVFGPVINNPKSLDDVNTSNKRFCDLISGKNKEEVLDKVRYPWVDVRDLALAHMRAFELDGAIEKRLLVAAGLQSKHDLVGIIKRNFPDLTPKLPSLDSDQPITEAFRYDNSQTTEILGPTKYSLEQSVVDTVQSLKNLC